MGVAARSTSALSIKGSLFSTFSSFGGSIFGSAFSSCYASRRLTSAAICKSFSSAILISFTIASLICDNQNATTCGKDALVLRVGCWNNLIIS
ncbi:hypothetical protein ACFX2K_043994 [Malus domestica]